jgi:transposase
VTLKTLKKKGQSNVAIAATLGVTEAAVRYHLRRDGAADGRAKVRKAEALREAIEHWMESARDAAAASRLNVRDLHAWLREEHGYEGSYESVLRFVRAIRPGPKLRAYRRVETPPGAQAQVDWFEESVSLGDGPLKLYGFVMTLSHSRMAAVVWRRSMDQTSWHAAHNAAFERLGGVPAVLRIDNLKTGIVHGSGPWGERNPAYLAYARAVGFHIDACLARQPQQKGKVEARVRRTREGLRLRGSEFLTLDELQAHTDRRLAEDARRRRCPPTGLTVEESWRVERELLRQVDRLPLPFDTLVLREVQPDCHVAFESRRFSVPFRLVGREVEVRGCDDRVQVLHEGRVVAEHSRLDHRLEVTNQDHFEGPGDERVAPPPPLGRLAKRILEISSATVEARSVDYYARLMEVAR